MTESPDIFDEPVDPPVLVIGATGPTGRLILQGLVMRGVPVRAMARNPATLNVNGVDVVRGDILDAQALQSAVNGTQLVISALGTPLTIKPVTLLSTGTRNLVQAMHAAGVPRLICITGMGAGDSRGHGGFVYDRLILPTLLRNIYRDKDRQEAIVRGSALDWLIVRPARLTDTPAQRRYRALSDLSGQRLRSISRSDVAHFIVREALSARHARQAINLTD